MLLPSATTRLASTAPWRTSDGAVRKYRPLSVVGVEARRRCWPARTATTPAPVILSMTLSETPEDAAPTMTSALCVEQLVDLGARDVGRAVTGVGLDLDDVLAEHAAGGVDVLDGQVDAGELRRAEEGEVTGLREQGADGQGAVALGGAAATLARRCRRLHCRSSSPLPQAVRTSAAVASTAAARQVR